MSAEDAAADESPEAAGEPEKKGMSGKKLVLFIILPILLLAGGGGGAYFAGLLDPLLGIEPVQEGEQEEEEDVSDNEQAVFYDLPELLVNLNTKGRKTSFLKISVSLELKDPNDIPRIEKVLPRVIDQFQVYLRELRADDLKGSTGIHRLREELLRRVNIAAKPAKILDVLFKEMLVQ